MLPKNTIIFPKILPKKHPCLYGNLSFSLFPKIFIPFGIIRAKVDSSKTKKLSPPSRPIPFLQNFNDSHFELIINNTNNESVCLETDFQPFHPSFDPEIISVSSFSIYFHHSTPSSIPPDNPRTEQLHMDEKYGTQHYSMLPTIIISTNLIIKSSFNVSLTKRQTLLL